MDPIQKEFGKFNNKPLMLYLIKLRVLVFEKKIAFGYTIAVFAAGIYKNSLEWLYMCIFSRWLE